MVQVQYNQNLIFPKKTLKPNSITYYKKICVLYCSSSNKYITKVEPLRWIMENMLQHSTCQTFETHCKKLIVMIKEPYAWPSFASKLEKIESLQICLPDFKITHIPRAQNQISDSLGRTAKFFYREICFISFLFRFGYPDYLKFE